MISAGRSKRSGNGPAAAAEAPTTSAEQMDLTYPFKIVGAVGVIFVLVYAVFAYATGTPGEDDVVSRLVRWVRAKWGGSNDRSGGAKETNQDKGQMGGSDKTELSKGSVRFVKSKPKAKKEQDKRTKNDNEKKDEKDEPTEPRPSLSCYVGEERGLRTCVPVDEAAQCLSGDVFPSDKQCVNSNMRYVGERS